MKKLIFLSITLLIFTACAKKTFTCGLTGEKVEKLQSTVTINENKIIADTTIVSISGTIKGSYLNEHNTITTPLASSNFSMIDIQTKEVFGTVVNNDGTYNLNIPAATYQLEVQMIGFNKIIVDDLQLGTGEILTFSAVLGQGIDKEYFIIQNSKTDQKIVRKTSN